MSGVEKPLEVRVLEDARQGKGKEEAEGQGPIGTVGECSLKSRAPLSPYPLQGKVLLVTLRRQTITHKLHL